jgi:GNAT superfamily N-acetyltransferase
VISTVPRAAILPLRQAVLRPNLPPETVLYPEDAHPEVLHLATRNAAGAVISCVTFFPEPTPHAPDASAWRFRGMATAPEYRGQGVGGRLLEAGVAAVAERGGTAVWCNGRLAAADFYRRHGFASHGEVFDLVPAAGPHYVFVRLLG